MALRDTASDLATVLAGAGLGLVLGTNLFIGPLRAADEEAVADEAVFVLGTGGEQEPYLAGGKKTMIEASVQTLIRGKPSDFESAQNLAFGVFEALNLTQPAGYVSVIAREGAPYFLGPDGTGRPLFTLNLTCSYVHEVG